MNSKYKTLENQLDYLKLSYIRDNYKNIVSNAEKKQVNHLDFLSRIIDCETIARQERALQRRLKGARLPYIKTMEQYNWSYPKK